MASQNRVAFIQILPIGAAFLWAPDTFAYLDPASGGMILQVVIGVIAGAAFTIKIYWRKILGVFKTVFSRKR